MQALSDLNRRITVLSRHPLECDRIAVSWHNRSAAPEPRQTFTELLAQPIAQMEEEYYCIGNQEILD
jgi:hypothetical protein